MIRIDRLPPGVPSCTAIPFVMSDPDGFVDVRVRTQRLDQPIYISHRALTEMNRLFGIPTEEEWLSVNAENEILKRANERLKDEVAEMDKQLAAIELLESEGYRKRKKPGRPKKETVDA